MVVGDIMNKNVIAVKSDMEIRELINTLLDNNIEAVPVIDMQNVLLGIVTNTDLISLEFDHNFLSSGLGLEIPSLKSIFGQFFSLSSSLDRQKVEPKIKTYKARDIMNSRVICVEVNTPIHEIVEVFVEQSINSIPVVDGKNKLLGIITRSDILRQMSVNTLVNDMGNQIII